MLEIGPSANPSEFRRAVGLEAIQWDTIDFADSTFIGSAVNKLTYRLSEPYNFPIADNFYDIVLSGQVIEHVEKIWDWMKEIKRITKKGGLIITINPTSWPYHEAPVDCWRIYPEGVAALASELDLHVETCLCESLEEKELKSKIKRIKTIPGTSYTFNNINFRRMRVITALNRIISHLPIRRADHFWITIEVAYDTISILRKV